MPDEAEEKESGGEKKGGFKAEWRKLATWQKAGVIIAGAALAFGVLYYWNKTGQNPLSGGSLSGASPGTSPTGYPGEGDVYPPTPSGSTGNSGFTNPGTAGSTSTSGLLGLGAKVQDVNGVVQAEQPGQSIFASLSGLLPKGTKVWAGASTPGSYWYELPGSNVQYLLTSTNPVPSRKIGEKIAPPSSAWVV